MIFKNHQRFRHITGEQRTGDGVQKKDRPLTGAVTVTMGRLDQICLTQLLILEAYRVPGTGT